MKPLEPSEHVDLNTGTTVKRYGTDTELYQVVSTTWKGSENRVGLKREEIRKIAELAGYEVREPDE